MTTIIQQLGRQTALMEKVSSTALVRAILRGALSPKSITRASAAMKPGQFRKIKYLGSGVYNNADLIAGNVGSHAGVGVRKLPTNKFVNPMQNYRGVQAEVDRLNKLIPTETGVPAIAPYYSVGNRGAFQHYTGSIDGIGRKLSDFDPIWYTGKAVPNVHADRLGWSANYGRAPMRKSLEHLKDLHSGNYGPGGQIHDFQSIRRPGIGSTKMYPRVEHVGVPPKAHGIAWDSAKWGSSTRARGGLSRQRWDSWGDLLTSPSGQFIRAQQNRAAHKWYDGMSQAQRAIAPGYTPPLRPIREGIVDAWSASPAGVRTDALTNKYPNLTDNVRRWATSPLQQIKRQTGKLPDWMKRMGIPSRAP